MSSSDSQELVRKDVAAFGGGTTALRSGRPNVLEVSLRAVWKYWSPAFE